MQLTIIFAQILSGPHYLDGYIGDICDGDMFKQNELFKDDIRAIQIIAYYDMLEVVNPLGTRTDKHKLGKHCHL